MQCGTLLQIIPKMYNSNKHSNQRNELRNVSESRSNGATAHKSFNKHEQKVRSSNKQTNNRSGRQTARTKTELRRSGAASLVNYPETRAHYFCHFTRVALTYTVCQLIYYQEKSAVNTHPPDFDCIVGPSNKSYYTIFKP